MRYWIFILLVGLSACSRQPQSQHDHLLTIEPRVATTTLFFSGTIQPLQTQVVPSPAEGVVVEMPFQYGERVQQGQLLFMLSSTKFLSDYKSALLQYLKAKNDYNMSKTQLTEAIFLHKNLLISDDDFKSKKSNYYSFQLALLQAKDSLTTFINELDVGKINFDNLDISKIDQITQAMHLENKSEMIRIVAPANGIILSANKNEEDNKKLNKGDMVKQGDVLAMIGEMSGLSITLNVNELTINQLKVGQPVKVTGIAFPNEELVGEIKRIDQQGEAASSGLPTFSITVEVPKLSMAEQETIHVGMSANVEIDISEGPQVMVPLAAIKTMQGQFYLQLYKNGELQAAAVKTGKTTMDSVAILSGLKPGDQIVIPN